MPVDSGWLMPVDAGCAIPVDAGWVTAVESGYTVNPALLASSFVWQIQLYFLHISLSK